MFKNSLTIRLVIINLLLLVLPSAVGLIFLFVKTRDGELRESLYHMQNLIDSRVNKMETHVNSCEEMLTLLTDVLNLGSPRTLKQSDVELGLKRFVRTGPSIEYVFYSVKNEEGRFIIWASNDFQDEGPIDVTDRLFLTSALTGQETMTLGFGPKKQPYVFITKSIKDAQGSAVAALTMAYNPYVFLTRVMNVEFNDLDLHFALFTASGISFADDEPAFTMHSFYPVSQDELNSLSIKDAINSKEIIYYPVKSLKSPSFQGAFKGTWKGDKRIGLQWPIPYSNGMLIIAISEKALFTPFYGYLWKSLIIMALACAFSSFIIWLLVCRLSEPLQQFINVITQVSLDNFRVRFKPDEAGYEINELGSAINNMLDNLQVQMDTLREEPVKQKTIIEELRIGHEIQQRILPTSLPFTKRFELAAIAKPALEVGGDFYDIFSIENSKKYLFAAIADGAGKGVPACLYSLCLRSMLRSYASSFYEITRTLSQTNELFARDAESTSMFATLFAGFIDEATLTFHYYSAGHLPAIVKHRDGSIEKLWTPGLPLGLSNTKEIVPLTYQLQEEDLLLLYTDGITEAMNSAGVLYGEARLMHFLEQDLSKTPEMTLNGLLADIENFTNKEPQNDDITALLVYVKKYI